MTAPVLYGADYSAYVRIVRLVLIEKGVDHRLQPIDIFSQDGVPGSYRDLHPFGKIPALDHDGFVLYETSAITRYVDEAFDGPPLQPTDVRRRAVMNQVIGIADSYLYPDLVWGIYVETVERAARGSPVDQERLAHAVSRASHDLGIVAGFVDESRWMAGPDISLADFHLAPMVGYLLKAPVGPELLAMHPRLAAWWHALCERASMVQLLNGPGEEERFSAE
ncbi:glutathione S-transferase family protein [Rhizobium sp. AQ_MP]|uniref:glutathione S-transferase family protein n=1 Tax=Rhizobium sp. AQ_MP TaxID=2761536 RepID=UPI0016397BBB|nr:glutathione S-transferase family protein [Rhizobium sp. AQ_MP]MBC2773963.1 glutathione S-transferase family protein [Rhizobium sp. AQ_MP]